MPTYREFTYYLDKLIEGLNTYISYIESLQKFEKDLADYFREDEVLDYLVDSIKTNNETCQEITELISLLDTRRWEVIPLAPPPKFN